MSIYKLAKRLASHIVFYHIYAFNQHVIVLPEYEKASLKLAYYLNCADHETTEKGKRKYYKKAWKTAIKLETYYDQVEMQEIDCKEYIIGKYIEKIKRALKKELLKEQDEL